MPAPGSVLIATIPCCILDKVTLRNLTPRYQKGSQTHSTHFQGKKLERKERRRKRANPPLFPQLSSSCLSWVSRPGPQPSSLPPCKGRGIEHFPDKCLLKLCPFPQIGSGPGADIVSPAHVLGQCKPSPCFFKVTSAFKFIWSLKQSKITPKDSFI